MARLADDVSDSIGSATTARYFGLPAKTVFVMIHKGPEVILYRAEEIEVGFRRGGSIVASD